MVIPCFPSIAIYTFPSATNGFQLLCHLASRIYLYFLLDPLFSTISYCSFLKIVYSSGKIANADGIIEAAFLYAAVFLVFFGLLAWFFIILVSQTYLHRLHNEWKLRSFQAYGVQYDKKGSSKEQIAIAMETLTRDKISMGRWELFISLVTLIADLVSAWNILGAWLK